MSRYFQDEKLIHPPVLRAAYSDRMAWILATCSQLAYQENEKTLARYLVNGGLKFIRSFEHEEEFAYLALHETYAVLAFRGTVLRHFQTIRADLDARFYHSKNGKLHRGFFEAYKGLSKQIERSLRGIKLPLYITGHSLGGAMALAAVLEVQDQDRVAACYTFGCPRLGDMEFGDKLLKIPVYRCVHHVDVVPTLPLFLMGYAQYGDFRYLTDNGKVSAGSLAVFRRIAAQWNPLNWGRLVSDHAVENYSRILREFAWSRARKTKPRNAQRARGSIPA